MEISIKVKNKFNVPEIGQFFFPGFDNIMTNLIELTSILTKPYSTKKINGYVDFMYRVMLFKFNQSIKNLKKK